MTRISAPTLYKCPACAGYFTRSVLTFLHFYDDVPEWSDGKCEQWWSGIGGPVGRCPTCSKIVWVEDATEVMPAPQEPRPVGAIARLCYRLTGDRNGRLRDERNWISLPREIKDAGRIVALQSAEDFLEAMAVLAPEPEDRETYLRRRLWWAYNDSKRAGGEDSCVSSLPTVQPLTAHANMNRLLELIERKPYEQVQRGELLRQLGRFDEAIAVLKAVPPDGYSEVRAVKIERLARDGDKQVRELSPPK